MSDDLHKFKIEGYPRDGNALLNTQLMIYMDGKPLRGVQNLKIELDADAYVPKIQISFFPKDLQIVLDGVEPELTADDPAMKEKEF